MPADLYLFFNDRLNIANPIPVITASSTDPGYSINNVREADLVKAWKGNDSTTVNEWLSADGGSIGWLGAGGQSAYAVLAYDTRVAHQDTVKLQYATVDDGAYAAPQTLATWNVKTPNNTEVTMEWKSFVIPGTAGAEKRYYRIIQFGNERAEATGMVTATIFNWGMFNAGDVIRLSLDYPTEGETPYDIATQFGYGYARTAGKYPLFSKYAAPGQRFQVNFKPMRDTFWMAVRDKLRAYEGPARAMYVQKEGLNNLAQSNFFMCRLVGLEFRASRLYVDQYLVSMEFETESWV